MREPQTSHCQYVSQQRRLAKMSGSADAIGDADTPMSEGALPTLKSGPRKTRVWPADVHREEIEERAQNGVSCEDITDALRTQYNVEIHAKTISRKRCMWGLRSRAQRGSNKTPSRRTLVRSKSETTARKRKKQRRLHLREELTARTQNGETAQQALCTRCLANKKEMEMLRLNESRVMERAELTRLSAEKMVACQDR